MTRQDKRILFSLALLTLMPALAHAQGFAGEIRSLQSVLDQFYEEMILLCRQLIGVARGLAGFGALWYIAARVWRHIANAEPVEVYPLLRPFALGLCILLFPYVISLINGVLSPLVAGTATMVKDSNNAIAYLLKQKEEALTKTPSWEMYGGEGNYDKWLEYTYGEGEEEGFLDGMGNSVRFAMAKEGYNFRNAIKQWLSEILQVLFEAAALCINTIRTFYLIVLAVIGPMAFGLAVYDGFQNTLTVWLARYINVFLWLPVANIFGVIISKIQENMLRIDLSQVDKYGETFFSANDIAYLIFMIIGIIGYFTVPSVANYIVHAGGVNTLLHKSNHLFTSTTIGAASTAATAELAVATGGTTTTAALAAPQNQNSTTTQAKQSEDNYKHKKLSGKT